MSQKHTWTANDWFCQFAEGQHHLVDQAVVIERRFVHGCIIIFVQTVIKLHWQLDFTFKDDKNTSMAKTGVKNLQIMKKIVLSILGLVKESYKISMKRIRYELSLDYENGVEKMLSMLDMDSVKAALQSTGKSPVE